MKAGVKKPRGRKTPRVEPQPLLDVDTRDEIGDHRDRVQLIAHMAECLATYVSGSMPAVEDVLHEIKAIAGKEAAWLTEFAERREEVL